jgi:uncharacterized protein YbbC (DUF1343 family)
MVKSGLDVFLQRHKNLLFGKRIAIVANPSSINSEYQSIVDVFYAEKRWQLAALFGPEHGLRGEMQDQELCETYRDSLTNLPVFSLYGQHLKPEPRMLENIDAVVFDMQDVGSRYYTFIYTLSYVMEVCGSREIPVFVLDRPNPINGVDVEGPVLEAGYESFVGRFPIPIRHGMTIGELALFFRHECGIDCSVEVIRSDGWRRSDFFDQTGLPWVLPSPNMPTPDTALVYPGMCLLEGTNVSEGRGTTRPFEIFGAPWIHPYLLVEKMREFNLDGVTLRPLYFKPTFNKFKGELCGGAQIHVTDQKIFRPVKFGLSLIALLRQEFGDNFQWKNPPYEFVTDRMPIDILLGNSWIRKELEAGIDPDRIEGMWQNRLNDFSRKRQDHLLYS